MRAHWGQYEFELLQVKKNRTDSNTGFQID